VRCDGTVHAQPISTTCDETKHNELFLTLRYDVLHYAPVRVTCNIARHDATLEGYPPMSIQIDGVTYFSVTDIQRDLKVPRQTIWRWRKAGHISQGRLYRGKRLVFTKEEVEEIRKYANRLEPVAERSTRKRRPRRSRSR
jgi:hypothetical protein